MKKIYQAIILSSLLFLSVNSIAVTHEIGVSNFQFSPASLNVNVGDTIVWNWVSGNHTTTSNSTIPAGATSWNASITSNSQTFQYVVTVAGTYDYHCVPHGFTGQFVAINTGITTPEVFANFNIYSLHSSSYIISYTLMRSADVRISLYDLTGKSVRVLNSSMQSAGDYQKTYYMDDLQKGIYIIELFIGNNRLTKRLILD